MFLDLTFDNFKFLFLNIKICLVRYLNNKDVKCMLSLK